MITPTLPPQPTTAEVRFIDQRAEHSLPIGLFIVEQKQDLSNFFVDLDEQYVNRQHDAALDTLNRMLGDDHWKNDQQNYFKLQLWKIRFERTQNTLNKYDLDKLMEQKTSAGDKTDLTELEFYIAEKNPAKNKKAMEKFIKRHDDKLKGDEFFLADYNIQRRRFYESKRIWYEVWPSVKKMLDHEDHVADFLKSELLLWKGNSLTGRLKSNFYQFRDAEPLLEKMIDVFLDVIINHDYKYGFDPETMPQEMNHRYLFWTDTKQAYTDISSSRYLNPIARDAYQEYLNAAELAIHNGVYPPRPDPKAYRAFGIKMYKTILKHEDDSIFLNKQECDIIRNRLRTLGENHDATN